MSRIINIQSAATFVPSSYDSVNSRVYGIAATSGVTNGLTEANSNTRVSFSSYTQAYSETNIYYNFDCSSIPQDATIDSVTCDFKAIISSNYFNTRIGQLCYGTTKRGSPVTVSNTSLTSSTINVQTITNGGTWTREELNDIKLLVQAIRGTSTNNFNISFFGATLTVNYSLNGTMYEIDASSETNLAEVEPLSQEVFQGGSGAVKIETDDIGSIVVEDNGTDVTNQLVIRQKETTGSQETVLGAYTLISGSFNGQGASYFQGIVGKGVDGSQTTSNYYSNGNGTIVHFTYNLSFPDVPSNASITRLYCQVNGHAESTSNNNEYMCVQLVLNNSGTTLSNEINFKSIGTSNSTQTLEATTLPTVSQLSNLKLYCKLGYYGGAINGATCYIEYTIPTEGNQFYYEYTIDDISADHTVVVSEQIIIPDEEDEEKTYYPVTISSVNAVTTPVKGTIRVESGANETILIYPADPKLTLALDNGVDISGDLISHAAAAPTYTVSTAAGASYGFELNNNNYYQSQNNGIDKSAAVCRVDFDLPVRCLVTIQYINYAEATYDFGVFGDVDTTLSNSYYAAGSDGAAITDSNYKLACNTSTYNTSSVQTITYEVPAGEHYIYIKYSKDDATSSNNDTLQFRISNIEELETSVSYYEYPLSGINQTHSLIFVFGDVQYYFIDSQTSSDCKLYPNGQMVALQGDDYRMTIVVKNPNDSVSVIDNNMDVTANLERKEVETVKDGVTSTTVNYIYRLSNIQTGHTIVVNTTVQGVVYRKEGGSWTIKKAYKKNSRGEWEEIINYRSLFSDGTVYISG